MDALRCYLRGTSGEVEGLGVKRRSGEGGVDGENRWSVKNIREVPRDVFNI
jgi:hypothetical protein